MLRWIRRNLDSLILSFILAVVVWYAATTEEARPTTQRFPNPGAAIEVRNLPPNMTLEGGVDERVTFTLNGPQERLNTLRSTDFDAWVDLEGLGDGRHEVRVQAECLSCRQNFIQVLSYEPQMVTVGLEEQREATFAVQLEPQGEVAAGFATGVMDVAPREVTVFGSRTQVQRVDRVLATFSISGLRSSLEQSVRVLPLDEEGRPVSAVSVTPEEVNVRVPVRQRRGFKDVAVQVRPVGTVAEGYWISNVSVEPSVVTVFGDPETVDTLGGVIETEPIDVSGATEDITQLVSLSPPEGIQLLDSRAVRVTINVQPLQGGTSLLVPVELVGLEPGLQAEASPEDVQVFLSGPLPVLQELAQNPDRVRVVIDLTQRGPGTYTLRPEVRTLPQLEASSVLPSRVEVEVQPAATPTPTPSP